MKLWPTLVGKYQNSEKRKETVGLMHFNERERDRDMH